MKRWNKFLMDYAENPKVDAFLEEVIEISKKHGLSISHEDGHGAFMVIDFDESESKHLLDAQDVVTGAGAARCK